MEALLHELAPAAAVVAEVLRDREVAVVARARNVRRVRPTASAGERHVGSTSWKQLRRVGDDAVKALGRGVGTHVQTHVAYYRHGHHRAQKPVQVKRPRDLVVVLQREQEARVHMSDGGGKVVCSEEEDGTCVNLCVRKIGIRAAQRAHTVCELGVCGYPSCREARLRPVQVDDLWTARQARDAVQRAKCRPQRVRLWIRRHRRRAHHHREELGGFNAGVGHRITSFGFAPALKRRVARVEL